jgi:hypothetical protein
MVIHIEGGTYAEGVSKQDVEENNWSKWNEVKGGWRKLHNEELTDL